MLKRVCVFCGSSVGKEPDYVRAAREFGAMLARRGVGLVYGGGCTGMMGAVADAALAGGAEVIGVIPIGLATPALMHGGTTEMFVVKTMHERKAKMVALSDAFVSLPGGVGTFDEFFETLTWAQLAIHEKPCGILNVKGYYDPLLALMDHAVAEKFVRREDRELLLQSESCEELFEKLSAFQPVDRTRWIAPVES